MIPLRRKPKRSIRKILALWVMLLSLGPLAVVAVFSMVKFEKALDREMTQRLGANAREIAGIFSDYKVGLHQKKDKMLKDAQLTYSLAMSDSMGLKSSGSLWLKQDFANSLTFFNRDGRMLVSIFKDPRGEVRSFTPSQDAIFLSDKYLAHMKSRSEMGLAEFSDNKKMSLILISKVANSSGRPIGYVEQTLDIDNDFLYRLKARTKLEVMIFKDNANLAVGSHPDFSVYSKDFFRPFFLNPQEPFFELLVRNVPYGFGIFPLEWDQTSYYIALGASKADAKAVVRSVNIAFLSVVGAVAVLVVITILFSTTLVLRPLLELVEALQSFESQEQAITIPVKNDTEIGLLTESFNQMSQKIWQARTELRKKIEELELANKELKETQARLVHSAKMISLGQLVAGVAHELNNPIGFIFSNMSHLREYSQKLIELVKRIEKDPNHAQKFKEDLEFDYIVKDMPKLISSCEDGARRTKDIVLGLRNFSRLEEAKVTEVDIHSSLDTTLSLLSGEIKNRIEIHRDYQCTNRILCYASQVNQVFMNILSNALQAISGSGTIWITTRNAEDKRGVFISIQDSGKGIPADALDKIFDPFFTTKGVGQGTGLGLSISYGIITQHGGDIQVKSEHGKGTEFIVYLPLQPIDKLSQPETT